MNAFDDFPKIVFFDYQAVELGCLGGGKKLVQGQRAGNTFSPEFPIISHLFRNIAFGNNIGNDKPATGFQNPMDFLEHGI